MGTRPSSCASVPKIPVQGQLHGYPIETTVDDERAKYYLENYLAGKREHPTFHQHLDALHHQLGERLPTRQELKEIAKQMSVDVAALIFGHQLLKQPGNPALQRQFLDHLNKIHAGKAQFPKSDVLILIVPGFDYVQNGHLTGADFARPRHLLNQAGYETYFIPLDPLGSVEANAEVITDAILNHPHRNLVIVGASSAGPAIHLSLGKLLRPSDLDQMKAWLNLGGILQGTPVVDHFSSGLKRLVFSLIVWAKDWNMRSFESMSTAISRRRFATLRVPEHIAIFNYLGLSLSGDISNFARDKYLLMRKKGPNDGLSLLPDLVAPNSQSILAPRSDHFFAEDPEIDDKTLALLLTIITRISPSQ
ncbi:MAG: hypothetical protein ETSY2_50835 [Candidatus Entotheonella gemina]|uniref:Alpha/beta hydrolase n=1 Tax=Candidatus Entotheonella gemina TaxID=1429439 RepID=W4L800_9BACT|nr:MAG: hypothetical protein ETSY2_50835 [Candidatus Entotheonella gemina]